MFDVPDIPGEVIFLCPGLLCRGSIFDDIVQIMQGEGCTVIITSAPLLAGIEERALALKSSIESHFAPQVDSADDQIPIHLIGKS
jgi:hypothetical protein